VNLALVVVKKVTPRKILALERKKYILSGFFDLKKEKS
jgi:hypothetical protein